MANYFVDAANGNDSTGTGAVGAPWKTISKAIAGTPAITMSGTGDTLYLIPGTYRERNITLTLTPGAGNVLSIIGDVDGSAQRTAGAGTIYTGAVVWTALTTSDTTWPTDANANFNLNSKSYLSLSKIIFFGGLNTTGTCINSAATSTNVTITSCSFHNLLVNGISVAATCAANTNPDWMVDSCTFFGPSGIRFTLTQSASAEYSINTTIKNCLFIGTGFPTGYAVNVRSTGSSTYNGYGVTCTNCTVIAFGAGMYSSIATGTTSAGNYQITCYNSLYMCYASMTGTGTTGRFYEDYNIVYGTLTSVTSGGHSLTAAGTNLPGSLLHLGESQIWGGTLRPFCTPWAGSPILGFGAGGTPPTTDWLGRPRPEGGSSLTGAAGYLERHDTAAREVTIVPSGQTTSWKLVGPSSQELSVAVDAATTTIAMQAYADANHNTGTPPQIQLVANGEIGIAAQTVTMTANTATWNAITFAAITPTAKGVVKIRLVSRPAAANGIAYFGAVTIS